jgi:hypothetical protein
VAASQRGGQLRPGADPELGVRTGQVVLDRPLGDEQNLRDLPVGLTVGRQLRHPQLARRQCVPPPLGVAAGPAAGYHELTAGLVGKGDTAHHLVFVRTLSALGMNYCGIYRDAPRGAGGERWHR